MAKRIEDPLIYDERRKAEWAWLAGFIDGDGSIRFQRLAETSSPQVRCESARFTLKVSLGNCDKEAVEYVNKLWPGAVYDTNLASKSKGRLRDYYILTWHTWKAVAMLKGIQPYLRTYKRKQAGLGIEFQESKTNPGRAGISERVKARRFDILDEVHRLRHHNSTKVPIAAHRR